LINEYGYKYPVEEYKEDKEAKLLASMRELLGKEER